ncbi:MAG TPA: hydroxyphenylacetyl-CoA thioesterase PaaI, partial [Rhizobiales bacterium]|nr:hydroxyphenylacetyl-CoA thioesterase PaaI [Hyphomicrobiales bacterium]
MTKQQVTDQQIAEQCGQKMLESDEASKSLGVSIIAIAPGQATIEMTIRQKMLNGHNTCHGGFLFTLADFAFAVACNSYNKIAVAASCNINFVRPAHVGDVLHASAVESYKSGRNGI